jgi:UDP-N-acetylmuramoylalanine--D-glutamate ligase
LETVHEFKPKISAILNITEDHIDRHKTMENYIAEKRRILKNMGQNEISVLNYDNCITKDLKSNAKTIFFSAKHKLDSLENSVYLHEENIFSSGKAIFPIKSTRVMPENALAATAVSLAAGVSAEIIADVLKNFRGVEHRLEFVSAINNADFYNDSKATNTDAAMKALESFDRPVILIGGGYDKATDFTPWVKMFGEKVKHLILIGQTAEQIAKTCDAVNFSSYEKADSLQTAVSRAKKLAKPNDIVLLSPACASFDMFKNFEERGELFKKYVKGGMDT